MVPATGDVAFDTVHPSALASDKASPYTKTYAKAYSRSKCSGAPSKNLPLTRQETHIILLVVEECPLQRHELYFLQGNISPKKPAIYILQIIFAAEYIAKKRILVRPLHPRHTALSMSKNILSLFYILSRDLYSLNKKTRNTARLCTSPKLAHSLQNYNFVMSLPNHFSEIFAIVPSARISSRTFCIFSLSAVSSLR